MAIYSESAGTFVPRYSRDYGFRLSKVHTINKVDPDRMERFLRARGIMCERPGCKLPAVGLSATRMVSYLCDDDLNNAEDIQLELAKQVITILAIWTENYMSKVFRVDTPGIVVVQPDPSISLLDAGRDAASGAVALAANNELPTVGAPTRAGDGRIVLPPFMVF